MAEEIAFENGKISNIQGLVTLTFDRVILHTVVHHWSTSNYNPNFNETVKTFCGQTDIWTFETYSIRRVDLNIGHTTLTIPLLSLDVSIMSSLCWNLTSPTCVQNLITVVSAVMQIWLVPTKILMVHVTWPRPYQGWHVIHGLATINMPTKFFCLRPLWRY